MKKAILLILTLFILFPAVISQKSSFKNYFIKLGTYYIIISVYPNVYLGESFVFASTFLDKDIPDLQSINFTKSLETTTFDYMGYSNRTIYIQKTIASSVVSLNNKKINLVVSTNETGEGLITLTTSGFISKPFKVKLRSDDLLSTEMVSDITEIK
jgi:hypothetical protein